MRAALTIEVDADELEQANATEALRVARNAAARLGVPGIGTVTPSLLGDTYLCAFAVTVDPA